MHVDKYLALLERGEEVLANALMLLSDRHSKDPEVRDTARMLAGWSAHHVEGLEPFLARYGRTRAREPEWLRSAMFHDPRVGALGLLRDLHDALLLAQNVHVCWRALSQAAQALRDHALQQACETYGTQTDRQLAWLETMLRILAGHALVVPADKAAELKGSVPLRPSAVSSPDLLWSPAAAALLLGAVGLLGLLFGKPWLLPSLGPSAFLIAQEAAHPAARPYNVLVGHLVGLAAGFAALAMVGAWSAPVVLVAKQLTAGRLLAAVLAVVLTLLLTQLLRASHPPAGATTLLVALGALQTGGDALNVAIGAALLAGLSAGLRWARMGRTRSKPVEEARRFPQLHAEPAPSR